MSAIIELQNIVKAYESNKVLHGIDLHIESGRFYALLGQNGAGKSTLMRILMRHEPPDSGTGSIFGVPLDKDDGSINQHIGYVSEVIDYAVGGNIDTLCNGWFPKIYKTWDRSLFLAVATELGFDLKKQFSQLSRGQKMQIAFAVALAIRPKLLLLDEITAVLDARVRAFFMSHLRKAVNGGGTVMMATNIVSEVHHHADQLLLLEAGQMRFNSPVSEISKQFQKFRKATEDDHPLFQDPACCEIGLNSDGTISYIITAERANRYNIPAKFIDGREVTAEDAFIYYTVSGRRQ